jgi:pimeloyl-ACP methyl ester carboxylesterase
MKTTLVVLHGLSMNGDVMRQKMQPLSVRLAELLDLEFVDAPHACKEHTLARLYAGARAVFRPAPPHLEWWNASDDGRAYNGYEASLELVRERLAEHPRVALLGFSQGATFAAALTALSERAELPKIRFAVMVAGRLPRSTEWAPLFESSLRTPSLHVWGLRDRYATAASPGLLEGFAASSREAVFWRGPHVVPTKGVAADAIVDFVRRQLS